MASPAYVADAVYVRLATLCHHSHHCVNMFAVKKFERRFCFCLLQGYFSHFIVVCFIGYLHAGQLRFLICSIKNNKVFSFTLDIYSINRRRHTGIGIPMISLWLSDDSLMFIIRTASCFVIRAPSEHCHCYQIITTLVYWFKIFYKIQRYNQHSARNISSSSGALMRNLTFGDQITPHVTACWFKI